MTESVHRNDDAPVTSVGLVLVVLHPTPAIKRTRARVVFGFGISD
jgi:hypothetical protein